MLLLAASTASAEAEDCANLPDSRQYVAAIHRKVYARWDPPETTARAEATIAFRVTAAGELTSAELRSSSEPEVGAAAVEALRVAAPYGRMHGPAACLANMRLVGRFSAQPSAASSRDLTSFWVLYSALMGFTLLLGLAAGLWRTRLPDADQELPQVRVAPGDDIAFPRSAGLQVWHVIVPGIFLALDVLETSSIGAALCAAFVIAAVVDWIRGRRVPLVRIAAGTIVVRASALTRPKRMQLEEVATWAASRNQVVIRSTSGRTLRIGFLQLRKPDRPRLLGVLEELQLRKPEVSQLTVLGLQRSERARLLAAFAAMTAVMMIVGAVAAAAWG